VTLITGNMKWRPPIAVTLIYQRLRERWFFRLQNLHASHHFVFFSSHPNLAQQLSLSFFLVDGCALSHLVEVVFDEVILSFLLLLLLSNLCVIKYLLLDLLHPLSVGWCHLWWIYISGLWFRTLLCLMQLGWKIFKSCRRFFLNPTAGFLRKLPVPWFGFCVRTRYNSFWRLRLTALITVDLARRQQLLKHCTTLCSLCCGDPGHQFALVSRHSGRSGLLLF